MTLKTALAAAALCLATPLLWAEETAERWYQVEILIFENPDYGDSSPEQWPTYPDLRPRQPAIEIRTDDDPAASAEGGAASGPDDTDGRPTPFLALPESDYQLRDEERALQRTRGFRILYHQAWQEPVPDRDTVIPIHIRGGEVYGQQPELQGYIDLYVERYLHLTTDLQLVRYAQTDNPFRLIDERQSGAGEDLDRVRPFAGLSLGDDQPQLTPAGISQADHRYYVATESIRLQQRRRMRSQELHYLDNPEFGLFIYITPIEIDTASP